MNIAIFINTPAQVFFYKNIVKRLEERGNNIIFLVRDYRETISVLNGMGINYIIYAKSPFSKFGKIKEFPNNILKASHYLKEFKPDILLGFCGHESFTSFLLKKPSLSFIDSEPYINIFYSLEFKLFLPFIKSIITPSSFLADLGLKHIKVNSLKELAYLHPKYFKPDKKILDILNIEKDEEYIILRFNAFDAVHDAGIGSFSFNEKIKLVKELEKYVKIFISFEEKIPKYLEEYLLKIPKYKIHDALFYAKMLITDTQTMATEASILGTPVVRCNSFVGKNDMGNFIELERKYKLIFNYRNPENAIKKAIELVQEKNIKDVWIKKKIKLLSEKIDLTAFMIWFIENFPDSFKDMKENPDLQNRFK